MPESYDIAISGAGITGLYLGYKLAESGLRTVIFEAGNIHRKKACGEFVNVRIPGKKQSFDFYRSFSPDIINEIILNPIKRFYILINGKYFRYNSNLISIDKDKFHDILIELCNENNVKIVEKAALKKFRVESEAVISSAGGKLWKSRYLIGADGCFSVVRNYIDNKEKKRAFAISALADKPLYEEYPDIIDFDSIEMGYVWCGQHGDRYNIGLGSMQIKEVLRNWKSLKNNFPGKYSRERGAYLLMSRIKNLVRDRVALIGEAGGFIGLATGAGISLSLWSVELILPYLISALDKNKPAILKEYEKSALKETYKRLTLEHIIHEYILFTQKIGVFRYITPPLLNIVPI